MLRSFTLYFFIFTFICIGISIGTTPLMAESTIMNPQNANSQKIPANRIDRTDFPSLFLAEPQLEGESVWLVQARLKELGYDIQPSGIYNLPTSQIVRLFQVAGGLEENGVVNRPVWEALLLSDAGELCLQGDSQDKRGRLLIEIDVVSRKLVLTEDGKLVKEYPVAVGKSKTPTPLGEWKVVHKGLNWGNGFGTRWMGLNVPWGIYGIHGTNKPGSIGSYASHGCIRMFNRHVEELYPLVPAGTRVRIVENGKMFPQDLKPVLLKKNSSGQRVVYVQSRLKELGLEFDRADGRYGNMTELAVKYFQAWRGLEATGEMDEATYRAMGMIE